MSCIGNEPTISVELNKHGVFEFNHTTLYKGLTDPKAHD